MRKRFLVQIILATVVAAIGLTAARIKPQPAPARSSPVQKVAYRLSVLVQTLRARAATAFARKALAAASLPMDSLHPFILTTTAHAFVPAKSRSFRQWPRT